MKKLSIFILIGLIICSSVLAISSYNETRELSKVYRNELLSQTDANEINVNVSIECNDDYCLWSAYQQGIISSRDNKIDKSYCNEYEILEDFGDGEDLKGECISYSDYTDAEIQDIVADAVQVRLENYADASIQRKADIYEDKSSGRVIIGENK
jgi:hypothetical protein